MYAKIFPVVSEEKRIDPDYADAQIPDEFFMTVQGAEPDTSWNYPFRLNNLVVIMCRSGYGELVIDLIRYEVKPNDLFLILPGSIIQLGDRSEDFLLYAVGASRAFMTDKNMTPNVQLFLHVKDNPKINLKFEDAETLYSFIDFIRNKLLHTDHIYRKEIVRSLFLGFCYEVSAVFQRNLDVNTRYQNRNETLFKTLVQLVMAHYKTERNVTFYAGKMCLTDKYLTKVIRQVSGKTVSEWIKQALIFDAKSQLKYTDKSIQEISNDLNFPNPSFFGKFFKQYTGMTPKTYRIA